MLRLDRIVEPPHPERLQQIEPGIAAAWNQLLHDGLMHGGAGADRTATISHPRRLNVRFGSSAAPGKLIRPAAAIGCEADITLTLFRMMYDHNGVPSRSRCRGKLTLPKLIIDPVCHAVEILKSSFLKIFLKKKRDKTRI